MHLGPRYMSLKLSKLEEDLLDLDADDPFKGDFEEPYIIFDALEPRLNIKRKILDYLIFQIYELGPNPHHNHLDLYIDELEDIIERVEIIIDYELSFYY